MILQKKQRHTCPRHPLPPTWKSFTSSDAQSVVFFGIKPSDNNELTHASDLAELGLAEELRMFFSGQEVVVLLGPIFRKPGGQQGHL